MPSIHILATTASFYQGGNSETLLDHFIEGIHGYGAASGMTYEVTKLDLQNMHIPHLTRDNRKTPQLESPEEQDFATLCQRIQESHGWIIATPVWNFGYPAKLKNVIDRIGFLALDYSGKKVRPKLSYMHMYYIWTCGSPELGWWGLMRWTAAMSLGWAMRYYGAKHFGILHASGCVVGKEVSKRKWQCNRAKKRGYHYAKRLAKRVLTDTPPSLLDT